jgi:hypothetical protein
MRHTRHLPRLPAWLPARWHALATAAKPDRGDSPVSTAVIVAIIAAGAVVVATAIVAVANGWVALIPTSTNPAP